MSWSEALPATLAALAIFYLPGAMTVALLGLRKQTVAGLAAPASITLIGLTGVVSGTFGRDLNILLLAAVTLVAMIVSGTARQWVRRHRLVSHVRTPTRNYVYHAAGLGIAFTLIGLRLVHIIGRPNDISQTYDNNFHLNAVKYILDSGNGSSLSLGGLGDGKASFYPAAWHDVVALVAEVSSSGIPVAITACTLIIGAVVWPLSCIFLVTAALGYKPLVLLMTGVISAGFGAFPYLMIDFGVLYPYFMALAVLPVAIALASAALGFSPGARIGSLLLLILLVLPGLGLSHPSGVLHVLAVSGLLLLIKLIQVVHDGLVERRWVPITAWTAGTVVYVFLLLTLWEKARPSRGASFWPPQQTSAQAIGEIISNGTMFAPVAWFISALLCVGIAAAFARRPYRWILGPFVLTAAFYVIASSWPKGDDRYFITGIWYNDANRLAGALPTFVIPLAVMGACWLADKFIAAATTSAHGAVRQTALNVSTRGWAQAVALLIVVFLSAAASQSVAVAAAQKQAHLNYILDDRSNLINTDELKLLSKLDKLVPEDAVVLGNPWTGAGLSYALGDREALVPHINHIDGAAEQTIVDHLDESASNPAVCEAVDKVGELYVLDFRAPEVHKGDHSYAGLDHIDETTGFTLITSVGDAYLYQFTGCHDESDGGTR